MNRSTSNSGMIAAIIAVLAIIAVVVFLNLPDRRTPSEKLGDAVEAVPDGLDKAAGELSDKPPAERAGDSVKSAYDEARSDLGSASSNASSKANHSSE